MWNEGLLRKDYIGKSKYIKTERSDPTLLTPNSSLNKRKEINMFNSIVSFVIISHFILIIFLDLTALAALVNFIVTKVVKIRKAGGKNR